MRRFIEYDGRAWGVGELAKSHRLAPATFRHRLERFGETPTGIHRALTTGIMSREAAGRIGAVRSPWRYRE